MFYAANETQLNLDFLSVNNQYEFGERHLNANADEVERLYNLSEQLKREDKFEESSDFYNQAKSMVGFFGKNGRVKMIRLKGCPSMGYLFGIESMINWCPMMKDFDMAANVGVDFDIVNGEKFICAYVPPIKEYPKRLGREGQRNKALKKFDRMIQGQFAFHYDTQQLNREIHRIKPEDIVTCSVKLHGCVDAETIINTDHGDFTIKDIVDNKLPYKIKAYDINDNKIIYVDIDQYYTIPNDGDWYEIELEDGRKLVITGNNPVWLPKLNCYRRTDELTIGDIVLVS